MRIDECAKCHQPFEVIEISGGFPGGKEREDITCPHCGDTTQEISSGVFRTQKLDVSAAEKWRVAQANGSAE